MRNDLGAILVDFGPYFMVFNGISPDLGDLGVIKGKWVFLYTYVDLRADLGVMRCDYDLAPPSNCTSF